MDELIEKFNAFLYGCETQGFSIDTSRAYAYDLLAFGKWFTGTVCDLKSIDQKTLQDWMIHMRSIDNKPRTINRRLACLRSFYRFCFDKDLKHVAGVIYRRGFYKGNKQKNYQGLLGHQKKEFLALGVKVPKQVMTPLRAEHVDGLLKDITRYRDLAIVLSMLVCGLRSLEVLNLNIYDLDFTRSQILIKGKGNKERIVPMPMQYMQVVDKYIKLERPESASQYLFLVLQGKNYGKPLTREGLRSFFRYRKQKLGFSKIRAHQLRHTFASDLARSGVPISTIQKLMGHEDLKSTEIYINLFMEDIQKEYQKAILKIEERYASLQNKTIT